MKKTLAALTAFAAAGALLFSQQSGVTEARLATETLDLGSPLTVTTDTHRLSTGLDATTFVNQSIASRPGIIVKNESTTGDMRVRIDEIAVSIPPELNGMDHSLWGQLDKFGLSYSVYMTPSTQPQACVGVEFSPDATLITAEYTRFDTSRMPQRITAGNADLPVDEQGTFSLGPQSMVTFCPVVRAPLGITQSTLTALFLNHLADALTTTMSFTSSVPGSRSAGATALPGMSDIEWSTEKTAHVTTAMNLPHFQPQNGTDGHLGLDKAKYGGTILYDVLKWRWPTVAAVDGRTKAGTIKGLHVMYRPSGTNEPFRPFTGSVNYSQFVTRVVDTSSGMYDTEGYVLNWKRGAVGVHFANWSDLGTLAEASNGRYTYALDIKFRFWITDAKGNNSGYYIDSPFYYATTQTFKVPNPTTQSHEMDQQYSIVAIPADTNLPEYFNGWGITR